MCFQKVAGSWRKGWGQASWMRGWGSWGRERLPRGGWAHVKSPVLRRELSVLLGWKPQFHSTGGVSKSTLLLGVWLPRAFERGADFRCVRTCTQGNRSPGGDDAGARGVMRTSLWEITEAVCVWWVADGGAGLVVCDQVVGTRESPADLGVNNGILCLRALLAFKACTLPSLIRPHTQTSCEGGRMGTWEQEWDREHRRQEGWKDCPPLPPEKSQGAAHCITGWLGEGKAGYSVGLHPLSPSLLPPRGRCHLAAQFRPPGKDPLSPVPSSS